MGEAAPTVLVVDDDPEVLETAIAIVEGLGYQVVSARNGREALSIIRADHSIAILFTDITMPGGIDGWELGRQSRAARPDLRLIYTSGNHKPVPDGKGPGYGPLLPKPWRASQLRELLRQALESSQEGH
jgi:CheY-like chemotaxis protein